MPTNPRALRFANRTYQRRRLLLTNETATRWLCGLAGFVVGCLVTVEVISRLIP